MIFEERIPFDEWLFGTEEEQGYVIEDCGDHAEKIYDDGTVETLERPEV